MALEHLSDQEYDAFKRQGLVGLDDDAYMRLKLPRGFGHPPASQQLTDQVGGTVAGLMSPSNEQDVIGQGGTAQGVAAAAGGLSDIGSRLASKVPGMEQIGAAGRAIAQAGDVVDSVVNAARPGTLTFGTMGAGDAARASLPQGPGSALLTALPLAGEAFGAMMPAAKAAGGALATGEAADVGAAAGRAATGVQANDFAAAIADPYMLKRAGEMRAAAGAETHAEAAGDVMNQIAERYGVKTGESALKAIPEYAGKATPTLADAVPFANDVHKNLGKVEELRGLYAVRNELAATPTLKAGDLQRMSAMAREANTEISPSGQALSDLGNLGMGSPQPRSLPNQMWYDWNEAPSEGLAGSGPVPPAPERLGSSPAKGMKEYLEDQISKQVELAKKKSDVANRIKELEKPMSEGGAPTMQDLVSARQVMSKRLSRPMYQNPMEAPATKTSTENIGAIDDALEAMAHEKGPVEPIEVPGYGKVHTLSEARDIYREAKIADNLSSFTPVNNNKTPSVLRMAATFMQALNNPVKGAASAVATSPRAWASGIKAAAFLRDLGAAAGTAARSETAIGPAAGTLSNIGQELSNEAK